MISKTFKVEMDLNFKIRLFKSNIIEKYNAKPATETISNIEEIIMRNCNL